jgi:hypothetical protein
MENMIRVVHPGSRIRMLTFYPSRIQGSKRHRIPDPDPQHCFSCFYNMLFCCAENTKTAVLVRGVKCSSLIQRCLKDLAKLKRPNAVTYNQKNDIRPFEVSVAYIRFIVYVQGLFLEIS